jgi:hypothetical protein
MPLQATSGAASYDAFGGGVAAVSNYIEECFSTTLYTGNGSTQTITNGIDLAGKGGLVWNKIRASGSHQLHDTARGINYSLYSDSTSEQDLRSDFSSLNANGFTLTAGANINVSGSTYASWTFRKQPKFFDVVTYTGNGVTGRQIPHNLGSVPGCIIIKRTNSSSNWPVYHRSLAATDYILLNGTGAAETGSLFWDSTRPTSTVFSVNDNGNVNGSGATYVAYLFAHDAGGFGLTGTDNVISCGSFTTSGGGTASVDLGYEPQWLMIKNSTSADNWYVLDNMRGMSMTQGNNLNPNQSAAESTYFSGGTLVPTSTGFNIPGNIGAGQTWIYIAIRRGPMKVPTTGTSVFDVDTTSNDTAAITTNFPVDLSIESALGASQKFFVDRLRGGAATLSSTNTNAEGTGGAWNFASNTSYTPNNFGSGTNVVGWAFRRAPGFFDEVCYTGTGSNLTLTHNLTVPPELVIIKARDKVEGWMGWSKYGPALGSDFLSGNVNSTTSFIYTRVIGTPTATQLTVSGNSETGGSGFNYVAYLFASAPGVSKVGGYTGNGSSQTLNMGFTGGARFFLVKRTDSTGDWWVYDSARGIVSSSDPALRLNSTAAEVTSADAVDTDSTGLIVNQESTCNINVNGATYIYLGIS